MRLDLKGKNNKSHSKFRYSICQDTNCRRGRMLFKLEHVEPILSGSVTQIRKNWGKPMAKVGSVHKAKTALFSKESFASIRITGLRKERLGEISLEDVYKEGYDDLESYKAAWKRSVGVWDPNIMVYIVNFELEEQYDSCMYVAPIGSSQPMQIDMGLQPATSGDG
jgi:hypothetical protein